MPSLLKWNGNVVRWGNPFDTFVDDIRGSEPHFTGYGVYSPPIARVGKLAGRNTIGKQGWNPNEIYQQIEMGNPVVVWTPYTFHSVQMRTWTAWDGTQVPYSLTEHAVILTGVDSGNHTVTFNDVYDGRMKTISMGQFQDAFSSFGNMAVVVQ